MAGIGFDLRRVLGGGDEFEIEASERTIFKKMRAYASAGMIAAGPWVITMLGLSCAGLLGAHVEVGGSSAGESERHGFLALMTNVFAFSLLTVHVLHMSFTRWIADTLYVGRHSSLRPGFVGAMGFVGVVQTVSAAAFTWLVGFDVRLAVLTTLLYVVTSLTWIAMIWLSVIRQYDRILAAFTLGVVTFWVTFEATGRQITDGVAQGIDLHGAVAAYLAGAALTLTLMIGLILRGVEREEFEKSDDADVTEFRPHRLLEVLGSVRRYPELVAAGFLYGLAIWVDKFVFWYAEGVEALPGVFTHPLYDSSFFLAYLTIIPALTVNLVHLETSFYERYRAYYAAILGGFPLGQIERRRKAMVDELRSGARRLLRFQGAVTIGFVVFAEPLLDLLGMPEGALRVFRFATLGAFFQVLFLITMLIQLYFDLRREAVISSAVFLIANAVLASWSVEAGIHTYGVGYGIASLLALLVAFALLQRAVSQLDFLTFTRNARPNTAS